MTKIRISKAVLAHPGPLDCCLVRDYSANHKKREIKIFRLLTRMCMKCSAATMGLLLALVPIATKVQAEPPVTGKEIFEQMCAGCHGTHGDGGEGHAGGFSPVVPTLANKEYMKLVTDDYLMLVIKKGGEYVGKIATMPAWEKRLSDEQIRSVIAHIRTF